MSSDYNEDRAYEMGFCEEDEELLSEKEFAQMLRDRTKPRLVTEEDLVNRAPNIYQSPLKREPYAVYDVPGWAVLAVFALFVAGMGVLAWWLR
jgi:hypothetical protein